jgi:DNA-directed RNA polymerase subunit M/transcription elongation factor TFIIS
MNSLKNKKSESKKVDITLTQTFPSKEKWRANVCRKLSELLDDEKLADEIEQELYKKILIHTSENEISIYGEKMLKLRYSNPFSTLLNNLNPKGYIHNTSLLNNIKTRVLSPKTLVEWAFKDTTKLFPEKWEELKKKQEAENDFLYKNQRKATSKRIVCRKCGKREVATEEQQLRSADEPMTTIYDCLNCGNKWRS